MSDRHIIKPIRPVNRIVGWLGAHAGLVIAVYVLVSAALVYPLLKMQPTATASQEPAGPLFEAHQLATERFASRTHRMVFIVEAREGNLLEQASLAELLANSERLRQDPELGPKLLRFPHPQSWLLRKPYPRLHPKLLLLLPLLFLHLLMGIPH